jgi:manganese/zinc/iron transport system substrate-binding protein
MINMKWQIRLALGALAPVFAFSAAAEPAKRPYTVVTTVGMITDIVANVAGDKATVKGLIGEGIDPHLYKPTRNDVVALSTADVVFYNGLLLEGKMADVLVKVARSGKLVHPVTDLLAANEGYVLESGDGHHDPHVWMDVSGWRKAVEAVVRELSAYDPVNASFFAKNGATLDAGMARLDEYARASFATIPEQQRVLVTAHDAFNYLGRAYGIEVRGIQGISTESEAGVKDIETLVSFLVERKIPAVFVETSVADKNVRALVEGAKARGHTVRIGGSLFSDAMGRAGTYEGTYIGMIDHNVTLITRALGGQAPETGLNGRLTIPTK